MGTAPRYSHPPLADQAPCIVVVGPPNSGKTALVNLLDRLMRQRTDRRSYVVKGSPDATGRYLADAPELRDVVKPYVKGEWDAGAANTIARWIRNTRRHVDLVWVDFGGRHGPLNEHLLRLCTHYIVVARSFDTDEEEERNGLTGWIRECERCGLTPVAHLRSIMTGAPHVEEENGVVTGTFRGDGRPEDGMNTTVGKRILASLPDLGPLSPHTYFDLQLGRPWLFEDLPDLAGRKADLRALAETGRPVRIGGGHVPLWAYAAALHCVLDVEPQADVSMFDPKLDSGFLRIPLPSELSPGAAFSRELQVAWQGDSEPAILHLTLLTRNRFLAAEASEPLSSVPLPPSPAPDGAIVASGGVPIWLHLTYQWWLRSRFAGRSLGVYDMNHQGMIYVAGPDAGTFQPWPVPRPPASV